MSRFLLSKKIWIGALILMIVFFSLTYVWFDWTNQVLLQAEQTEKEQYTERISQESAVSAERMEPVAETVQGMTEPIEKTVEVTFPCMVQLREGEIGIYNEGGQLCRNMRQSGEYLSAADREPLQKGIWIADPEQLILLCESYHLQ